MLRIGSRKLETCVEPVDEVRLAVYISRIAVSVKAVKRIFKVVLYNWAGKGCGQLLPHFGKVPFGLCQPPLDGFRAVVGKRKKRPEVPEGRVDIDDVRRK